MSAEMREKMRLKLEKDKEERQKEKEERQKEREKEREIKREEKRIKLQFIKEWHRVRDDLDCDDHKVSEVYTLLAVRLMKVAQLYLLGSLVEFFRFLVWSCLS